MTKENLLVRVLGSCETMANASVICTDKTGTLTQNEMTIIAGSIGIHAKFVWQLNENLNPARAGNEDTNRPNAKDSVIDISNPKSTLTPQLVELLNASVAINSTTFKDVDSENGATVTGARQKRRCSSSQRILVGQTTRTYTTPLTSF
jgi:Ca2+-transporting ATPase